jgi:hypothetical protein
MEADPNIVMQYFIAPKSGLGQSWNPLGFEMNLLDLESADWVLFHLV